MWIFPFLRGAFLGLLFVVGFCYADEKKTHEVVGFGECTDCALSHIKASEAFSGLTVNIKCKTVNGEIKTRGVGELDKEGKFYVSLPQELVKDGDLNEECYANLQSALAKPCPSANGLEGSKIILKSKTDGNKHSFVLSGKIKFSLVTCASATFWPYYKKPFPHSIPIYKKPFPPFVPMFKKPCPPSVPNKEKPLPPSEPKPKMPYPPSEPKPKKPYPPSVPVKKKVPPQAPEIKEPLPKDKNPFPQFPPFTKTPCPPFSKWPKYLQPFIPAHP